MHGPSMEIMKLSVKSLLKTFEENDFVNVAWVRARFWVRVSGDYTLSRPGASTYGIIRRPHNEFRQQCITAVYVLFFSLFLSL